MVIEKHNMMHSHRSSLSPLTQTLNQSCHVQPTCKEFIEKALQRKEFDHLLSSHLVQLRQFLSRSCDKIISEINNPLSRKPEFKNNLEALNPVTKLSKLGLSKTAAETSYLQKEIINLTLRTYKHLTLPVQEAREGISRAESIQKIEKQKMIKDLHAFSKTSRDKEKNLHTQLIEMKRVISSKEDELVKKEALNKEHELQLLQKNDEITQLQRRLITLGDSAFSLSTSSGYVGRGGASISQKGKAAAEAHHFQAVFNQLEAEKDNYRGLWETERMKCHDFDIFQQQNRRRSSGGRKGSLIFSKSFDCMKRSFGNILLANIYKAHRSLSLLEANLRAGSGGSDKSMDHQRKDEEIETLKQNLEEMREQAEEMVENMEELEEERDELAAKLGSARNERDEVYCKLDRIEGIASGLKKDIQNLEKTKEDQTEKILHLSTELETAKEKSEWEGARAAKLERLLQKVQQNSTRVLTNLEKKFERSRMEREDFRTKISWATNESTANKEKAEKLQEQLEMNEYSMKRIQKELNRQTEALPDNTRFDLAMSKCSDHINALQELSMQREMDQELEQFQQMKAAKLLIR